MSEKLFFPLELSEQLQLKGQNSRIVALACERYMQELLNWNQKINLTAITDWAECWEKHIIDSLQLLEFLKGTERLLDLGSGAGLPGLVLALAVPQLQVTSLDKVEKKIRFQRHCQRLLQLNNVQVVAGRIEQQFSILENSFDVVVCRALNRLADFARLAQPFLVADGRLIAMKSTQVQAEIEQWRQEGGEETLTLVDVHEYRLPYSGAYRALVTLARRT